MADYLLTILLYAVVYIVSILFFYAADHAQSKNRMIRCMLVGIALLSVFAGIRNPTVGSDTIGTTTLYFDIAQRYDSIGSIFSQFSSLNGTFIYLLISKIVIALGLGTRTFLGILQALTVTPIAICAYHRKKYTPIPITMALYIILYYQLSFNWVRQSVSVAILLLAVVLYFEDKKVVATILLIASTLFHSSALFGIPMIIVARLASNVKKRYLKNIVLVITVILTFIIMQNWQRLSIMGVEMGILPYTYRGYINVFSGAHGTSFRGWFAIGTKTYVEYFLRVLMFMVPLLIQNNLVAADTDTEFAFFRTTSLLSLLIYSAAFFGLHTAYGNRVTYLLDLFNIIYFGYASFRSSQAKGLSVPASGLLLILISLFYNIWLYYVLGWHDTVPYLFSF